MEILFFVAMFILLGYVIYRNVGLLQRYKHNKEYISIFNAMLEREDDAYSRLNDFINNEKSEEFKNKGRIIKIFADLENDLDPSAIETLEPKEIFYHNGRFASRLLAMNCDSFVWLYLVLARARRLSRFDVIDDLSEKMKMMPEMAKRIEFQLFFAIEDALCEKDDAGVGFLSCLLEGDYADMKYEKNLIGLFKRFASATLAYAGEPMDDYFRNDLHSFAATKIGRTYMQELEIYDKYPPLEQGEEKTEETE